MEQSNDQVELAPSISRQPSPTTLGAECTKSQQQNIANAYTNSQEQNGQQHQALELQLSNTRKELESMVLKYARNEMIVLQNKNRIDDFDKKLRKATKDNETLLSKVKDLNDEKSALLGNLNSKIVHASRCEQENERLKQDLSIKTERLEVVQKQFETEQEVHQLTKKQLMQAKESLRRLQSKLDQKQRDEFNKDKAKCTSEMKCDTIDIEISNKDETDDHLGPNSANNINEVHHDHDSAIFTNTTSDVDSMDHSNDKENLDGQSDSSETKDFESNNHTLEEDDDETVEYDRGLNTTTTTNTDSSVNIKRTTPSGPSLQEQHRVIEMAKLERKIMELKDENLEIGNRLKKLDKLYKDSECSLGKSKLIIDESQAKITSLSNELDRVKVEISNEEQKSSNLERKLIEIESVNAELEKQIESYKSKEGELLEFTERLSLKQAMLQSELSAALQRVPEYEERFLSAKKHSDELTKQRDSLNKQLNKLRQELMDEKQAKETLVREKETAESQLSKSIDELQNEMRVLKKKHLNSIKELNKELKNLQNQLLTSKNQDNASIDRKLPSLESRANMSDTASVQSANLTNCPQVGQPDCASSIGSRTSSSTSLEVVTSGQNLHVHHSTNRDNLVAQDSVDSIGTSGISSTENHQSSCKALHDYDKSSLVDWIVKLQRHIVKRDEKIDILQEQINQLIEEVKKKGRLLQHFILREESGLLSTDTMEKNKQQLAKRGSGIMSSLYSSSANDSGLTLELSLEINKKLQALLEDTILKNITLKESLSTLGSEIARLNKSDLQKQQIK